MKIVTLDTGLFPDGETVEAALGQLESGHDVRRLDVPADATDDAGWDKVLADLLAADMIITT